MKQNPLNSKSYSKSVANRRNIRHDIFEKNRQQKELSYLSYYPPEVQSLIKESISGVIPQPLPSTLSVETASYWRRSKKKFFRTRLQTDGPLDPHLTYESLGSVASKDEETFDNWPAVVETFEMELKQYLFSPYSEIKEMAIIAAGNQSIGKEADIMCILDFSEENVWVLINHVYDQKISFKRLLEILPKNIVWVYRAVYEMSNNEKDDIILEMISSEQLVSLLLSNVNHLNKLIQTYSIRILGNILAQAEDYAGDLTHYHIVDKLLPYLSSNDWQLRRDCCWLLANYVYEPGAATEILNKLNTMQRLIIMFKSETNSHVRTELYFILSHLVMLGHRETIYKFAIAENFLQQCSQDLDNDDTDLSLNILNLIDKLIDLGEQFLTNQDEETRVNPFAVGVGHSFIRLQVVNKTYCQNREISQLSQTILEKVSHCNIEEDRV